ncbi:MAG: hypothetical protein K8S54_08730 [Spirochaetia bacterium]|nr:hypothetical protein [Spirochaetia bacterium]
MKSIGTCRLTLALALAFFLPGCASVFKNHEAGLPAARVARLKQTGLIFRLYEPDLNRPMTDVLSLTPGEYMLEFQLPSTGEAGKARCVLSAGKTYGLRISEKRYLPQIGSYVILGLCFETP